MPTRSDGWRSTMGRVSDLAAAGAQPTPPPPPPPPPHPASSRDCRYEEHKQLSECAMQRVAEADGSDAASEEERERRKREAQRQQTESLRMAMALQSVFDSLIPYFVCRTVLETQLEERKQAVTDAQAAGKEAKRAYHRAMDDLEKISLEIQAEQAKKREESAAAAAAAAEAETAAAAEAESASAAAAAKAARDMQFEELGAGQRYTPDPSDDEAPPPEAPPPEAPPCVSRHRSAASTTSSVLRRSASRILAIRHW